MVGRGIEVELEGHRVQAGTGLSEFRYDGDVLVSDGVRLRKACDDDDERPYTDRMKGNGLGH